VIEKNIHCNICGKFLTHVIGSSIVFREDLVGCFVGDIEYNIYDNYPVCDKRLLPPEKE
jgi:hypothetical protein